jgi:drug/metabolite transporter (DMT)-like permease
VCVFWWKEPADWRNLFTVVVASLGVAVIVAGGWTDDQLGIVLLGLASGVFFAGVLIGLRVLCRESSRWLTVVNFLTSAVVLLPAIVFFDTPTRPQLVCLFLFGAIQLAVPYWLITRGLRSVSPQEAGMLTLIEPLLSPLWAYLIATEKKPPHVTELIGGAFILAALAWRYAPQRNASA